MWEMKALNTLLCKATSISGLCVFGHVGANSRGEHGAKTTPAWDANQQVCTCRFMWGIILPRFPCCYCTLLL